MPITHTDYVPILKWRQGEYQALWRLADATKDRTIPLIADSDDRAHVFRSDAAQRSDLIARR